jgi:hypothetical protein
VQGIFDFPKARSWMRNLETNFPLVEKGWLTQHDVFAPISFGLPQDQNIGESSGHPCKAYKETSPFSFNLFPSSSLFATFLSPLTFLFFCFFFPSVYWLALGLVNFTLCTSDIWVIGAAELGVWLAMVC